MTDTSLSMSVDPALKPRACLFCRKKLLYRQICMTCRSGFVQWVVTYTNIKRECAVHKLLCKYNNLDLAITRDVKNRKWCGFHIGDGEYVKPDIYISSNEDIMWDNECAILEKLLNDNNIYIQNDQQWTGST